MNELDLLIENYFTESFEASDLFRLVEQVMDEAKISIQPVNMGNVAEGLFVLGAVAKAMKGGGNISGKDVMAIRQDIASKTATSTGHEYKAGIPQEIGGHKAEFRINLEDAMFNALFLPGGFTGSEDMEQYADVLSRIVSKNNRSWAEKVQSGDWESLRKMYMMVGEKLSAIAESSAKYWNTTGANGWSDLLKMLDRVDDSKVVTLVADGLAGANVTTADAWVEVDDTIVGEFSLKADSAQISQAGGPGSKRKVTKDEQGAVLSDKGGGIAVIGTKLGIWDDIKAGAPTAVKFFKENPSPSTEDMKNPSVATAYVDNWNDAMVAAQAGLDRQLSQPEGKLQLLTAVAALITGGEDNLDMKYVDLAQSGKKAKVAFPESFPAYAGHIDLSAKPTRMGVGKVEKLNNAELKQPLVKIKSVTQLPDTIRDFDEADMGYKVTSSLDTIKEEIMKGLQGDDISGAESAIAIFGAKGLASLGVNLSKGERGYLKYDAKRAEQERDYKQKRNEILARIKTALRELPPDNTYAGIRDKLNSLLPKAGDDLINIRWKLRVGSRSPESRTYVEKRSGMNAVAAYTKYLTDIGAEVSEKTQEAIANIIEASKARLDALEQ